MAAALICLAASGCAQTTGGLAKPSAPLPAATADTLHALLLSAADVGTAMGHDVVVTREVSQPWNDSAHFAGPGPGCLGVAGAAQRGAYAGLGWPPRRAPPPPPHSASGPRRSAGA